MTHWGALQDQQRGPAVGELPIYRPPSARFRRAPIPLAQPQTRVNNMVSPIVIDDDDGTPSSPPRRTTLQQRLAELVRQQSGGAEGVGPGFGLAAAADRASARIGMADDARGFPRPDNDSAIPAAAAVAADGQDPFGPLSRRQPRPPPLQQHQQDGDSDDEEEVNMPLPDLRNRGRRVPLNIAMPPRLLQRPGDAGPDINAGGSSSVPATAASSPGDRSRSPALLFRVDRFPKSHAQPQRRAFTVPFPQRHAQPQAQGQQPPPLQRLHTQRAADAAAHEDPGPRRQRLQAQAGDGAAATPEDERRRLQEMQAEEDLHAEDMRLAARLQQEDDERLARETARRMEHEEYRRMMSRLDMLETLEDAAEAAAVRRNAAGAGGSSAGGLAGRRSARAAAAADLDLDAGPMWRMPRPMGAGGNLAGRQAAAAGVRDDEGDEARSAAGGRGSWGSRSLRDMLPAMAAMAFPYGLQRVFLGPEGRLPGGDDDDTARPGEPAQARGGRGAPVYQRRNGRAFSAYQNALAMRDQVMAAQRAAQRTGLPAHVLLGDRDFTPEDYEALLRLDEHVENRKGAKEEQLQALPTEVVAMGGRRRSDGAPATCAICMEDLAPGDLLKRLPCAHDFHAACVDTWLKTKACCPVCQRELDG